MKNWSESTSLTYISPSFVVIHVALNFSFYPRFILSHWKDESWNGIWKGVVLPSLCLWLLSCHSEQGLWKYKCFYCSSLSLLPVSVTDSGIPWRGLIWMVNNGGQLCRQSSEVWWRVCFSRRCSESFKWRVFMTELQGSIITRRSSRRILSAEEREMHKDW